MTLKRREFLAAVIPFTLILPSLELQRKEIFDVPIDPLKVFLVSDSSDAHHIIARSGQLAAHYWYTELGGEPIPKDVCIKEVDPEENIRCDVENADDLSSEDRNNYLRAVIILESPEGEQLQDEDECLHINVGKPITLEDLGKYNHAKIRLYIEKPAKLYLKESIENEYPMPCCFCTTAS
jgi:hypothetical protein